LIGVGGLLGAAGQLSREVSPLAGSRRTAYQIERGAAPLEVDGRHESIAVVSAAILSALQGFLDAIPELSGRRQRFEALRRRPDREILGPFDTHWLDPLPAPHQAAHNAVQRALVQSLGLEAIVRAPARAETEARDAAATSGRIAS
jgi:hypothetical protein